MIDAAWNEIVLDISTPAKRRALAAIVGRWIDGCRRAGFQAIEPDNLDSYTRSRGALTAADAKAFARLLTARAHAAGMAIAQKNAAEFAPAGQSLGFDFAIAEECNVYHECGAYTKAYGARVFEIEYPDNGGVANYQAACEGRGKRISIVYRDRAVVPRGRSGYQFRGC